MPASPSPPAAAAETSPYQRKPARHHFTRSRDQSRLSAEQAARQGQAVSSALRSFADSAAAIAFLTSDQAGLGRPIDRAIESAAGLTAVEAALASRSAAAG